MKDFIPDSLRSEFTPVKSNKRNINRVNIKIKFGQDRHDELSCRKKETERQEMEISDEGTSDE